MDTKKTAQAYTLVEVLVYAAIIVVVLIFVVTAVVQLTKPLLKLQNTRHVNEAGEYTMDRIVRELRRGTQITAIQNNQSVTFKVRRTFGEQVKHDNPVAHWDFEDTSGSTLNDKIGNNSGAIYGDPIAETGVVGNGRHFSSALEQYVDIGSELSNSLTSPTGAVEAIVSAHQTGQTPNLGYSLFSAYDKNSTGNNVFNIFGVGYQPRTVSTEDHPAFGWAKSTNNYVVDGSTVVKLGGGSHTFAGHPSDNDPTATKYDRFYHVVWERAQGSGSNYVYNMYINGVKVSIWGVPYLSELTNADLLTSYWFNSIGNWNLGYIIGAGKVYGLDANYVFDGIIDEIAVYDAPKSEGVWKSHYDAAWGVDNVANDKDVILQYNAATQQLQLTDDGAASTISNTKISISNFVLEPITLNGNRVGVRIGFTATAGAGDTAVSQQFQTSVMMRNPNYE